MDTLDKAMIVTEYGYDRTRKGVFDYLPRLEKLLLARVQGIRTTGACCADMCLVASGKAGTSLFPSLFLSSPYPKKVACKVRECVHNYISEILEKMRTCERLFVFNCAQR